MDTFRVAITGASSGIGRALAMCFSYQATHLYLAGRNIERLEQSKAHILALNPQVQIEVTFFDVSVEKAAKKMYIAIKKGKRFYAFPYLLAYVARFYNILPLWLKRTL